LTLKRKKLRKVSREPKVSTDWNLIFDYLNDNLKFPEFTNVEDSYHLLNDDGSSNRNQDWKWVFWYLFIYACLIWLFSLVYKSYSYEFYYPNLDKDPEYKEELQVFRDRLKSRIINHFETSYGTTNFQFGDYSADLSNINISTVRTLIEGIEVRISGFLIRKMNRRSFPLRFKHTLLLHNGCMNSDVEILESRSNYKQLDSILMNSPLVIRNNDRMKDYLKLDKELCDQVFLLCRTKSNSPILMPSNLANRMLYFSASTMTGLGLGDILPLSNRMRMLSIIQSLTGLLVIGLFLNTLARRYSNKE